MRITESKLRRIIRSLISEAPLADLYPPRTGGSRAIGAPPAYDSGVELNRVDTGKVKADRIFGTKSFKEKLKKLTASWPVDVWVAPVAVESEEFLLDDPRDRLNMFDPEEILQGAEQRDPELQGVVRDWMSASGGRGALIVPYAKGSAPGVELTPWMILHSMFNTMPRPGSSGFSALEGGEEIVEIVNKAVKHLFSASRWCSIKEKEALEAIEGVFTMGSARNRYFSKFNEFLQLNDIDNEAAVQSITTGGFRYDKKALQDFRDICNSEEAVPYIDLAQDLLDQAVTLSPKARSDFMRGINGKVVIVNVT